MITKIKKLFVLLLLLQIFWPARLVLADTGPKPTMDLMTGDLVTIISVGCTSANSLNVAMHSS